MAQGRDGFLWLGTSTGLYRFDGLIFERFEPVDADTGRSLQITAVLAARNGDVWVGYDYGGIGLLRNGKLRDANPWPAKGSVQAMVEGSDGAIWFASNSYAANVVGRLLNGRWEMFDVGKGILQEPVQSLLPVADGGLFIALFRTVLKFDSTKDKFFPIGRTAEFSAALAQDPNGRIWLGDDTGLQRFDRKSPIANLQRSNEVFELRRMQFDRDGSLWITGQAGGITRIPALGKQGLSENIYRAETFGTEQGLTSLQTLSVLEDREGNLWIGTRFGLDRFSANDVAQTSFKEGMMSGFTLTGPTNPFVHFAGVSGIYRLGKNITEPKLIFPAKLTGALCDNGRELLVLTANGDFLVGPNGPRRLTKPKDLQNTALVVCAADDSGTFWTGKQELFRVSGTTLKPATGAIGRSNLASTMLRSDNNGGLLVYLALRDLIQVSGNSVKKIWAGSNISIGFIKTSVSTSSGFIFGGEFGIARYENGNFTSLTTKDYPFLANVTGILQTSEGRSWIIGAAGIVAIPTEKLAAAFDEPGIELPYRTFGYQEGFRGRMSAYDTNDIAQDERGRLWFATNLGLAFIDPARLVHNALAPPVIIRSFQANGTARSISNGDLHLPIGTNRIEVGYTALSLTDATANRFRYRLDGVDQDWVEAGNARQAVYTNLAPGEYAFRVTGSNNDEVWNVKGARLNFTIAPAFYQTGWFFTLCIVALGYVGWLFYRRRIRATADRTRARIETQVAERERIARELHDTLLQGVHGLMLRFQAVADRFDTGAAARAELEKALEHGDDVLIEGRDRVLDLRSQIKTGNLEELLRSYQEFTGIPLSVTSEGSVIEICPTIATEIAAIVKEALINIGRHARAAEASVTINYGLTVLTITIQDNGIGISPSIREALGRAGHFGLVGMRERSYRIGGGFVINVPAGGGTAICITIPASIAYSDTAANFSWWHKLAKWLPFYPSKEGEDFASPEAGK